MAKDELKFYVIRKRGVYDVDNVLKQLEEMKNAAVELHNYNHNNGQQIWDFKKAIEIVKEQIN